MKLPKAKKLPSGSWNVQVMVDGKRVSVTAPNQKEAIAEAAAIKAELKATRSSLRASTLTVGEAIDHFIESRDSVLSPATILGYKKIRKNHLQDLMDVKLSLLTQEAVQKAINKMAKSKSPKTVKNAHGLLTATLAVYRPELVLRTTLPQKRKYEAKIPDLDEVRKILEAARGKEIEVPILLAVWMGLRESEIRGLTWDCIDGDMIHIKQAIVDGEMGPADKGTKTYSGDRWIRMPDYVKKAIESRPVNGDHIVKLSGRAIYMRFTRLCAKLELPHYRFHDLRHAAASIAMSIGVPNTYTQKRMGHKTDNMLKTVYLHTIRSMEDQYADAIDQEFNQILQMNLQMEKRNALLHKRYEDFG